MLNLLDSGLAGAHKEKCPHKRGFLEGKPSWGSCGGKNGCHTETSASCRTKCFDNPSCKAWTFNSRQKHCLLRRGGSVSTSASYNSVWGLPCRATGWNTLSNNQIVTILFSDCQDMSTHKSWHYNGQWWFTRIVQASEFYVGTTSTTRSGKTCRNWSKVRGHEHVGDHNHCRNPNSQWEGVGCYTEDGGNELCNVPKCRTNTLANPIWQWTWTTKDGLSILWSVSFSSLIMKFLCSALLTRTSVTKKRENDPDPLTDTVYKYIRIYKFPVILYLKCDITHNEILVLTRTYVTKQRGNDRNPQMIPCVW